MKTLNKTWFSLIISMMLVIVIILMAIVVLEIAVPFSRNIKWIENSSNAYYQANTWVEWALRFISQKDVWSENAQIYLWKSLDYKYRIEATWSISPVPWRWDSDFDKDWSKISWWSPVQMEVWFWKITFTSTDPVAYFRVPNFSISSWWWQLTLSWSNTYSIVNWQLSWVWDDKTLNATWSYLKADKVCKSNDNPCGVWLKFDNSLIGLDLAWLEHGFKSFYNTNCWAWNSCILKLSVINKLELTTSSTPIPYLEWKADFWSKVPTRTADVTVSWKSYWFRKDINVWVPQKTLIDSFDFTVFQ
jgi:hypothetical protein